MSKPEEKELDYKKSILAQLEETLASSCPRNHFSG
jgi:hypothetical protein